MVSNRTSYQVQTDNFRKVVLLGDAGVGKSSLISRFVYNQVTRVQGPTVGAQEHARSIYLNQSCTNLTV